MLAAYSVNKFNYNFRKSSNYDDFNVSRMWNKYCMSDRHLEMNVVGV